MADPTGFEPAISCVTGRHVGPLHHGSATSRKDSTSSIAPSRATTRVMPDPGSSNCRWQTRRPQASNASSSTSEPWWSRGGGRVSRRSVAAIQLGGQARIRDSRRLPRADAGVVGRSASRGDIRTKSGGATAARPCSCAPVRAPRIRARRGSCARFLRPGCVCAGSCQIRRLALLMVESGRFRVGSVATADDLVHESPHPTQPRADSAAPTDHKRLQSDDLARTRPDGRLSHGTRAHHGTRASHGTTATPPRVRPR